MKARFVLPALCCSLILGGFAAPTAHDVSLSARSDGSFEIVYALDEAPAVVTFDIQVDEGDGQGYVSIGDANLTRAAGDVNRKVTAAAGKITWWPTAAARSLLARGPVRAAVRVWPMDDTPDYMAVSLANGFAAAEDRIRYYVSSNAVPGGVLDNLDYRTTTILLRKIRAKGVTWWMGSDRGNGDGYHDPSTDTKHQAMIDHNYYFAVFPLTQSQVCVIKGGAFQYSAYRNETRYLRLQDTLLFSLIRGANYPAAPAGSSILGLLRTKTGGLIDFDLPSEAEWEYAARAGHGTGYWGTGEKIDLVWSSNIDDSKNVNGRYRLNQEHPAWEEGTAPPGKSGSWCDWGAPECGVGDGTPIAGSYAPNSWGIYDTSGGVLEMCNDWFQADITALNGALNINPDDPTMPISGPHHVGTPMRAVRGGSWASRALSLVPGNRGARGVTDSDYGTYWDVGMRVKCCMGLRK